VGARVAGVAAVGVVGAGTMGSGIAQVALEAGHEVLLHDVDEAAIARGRDRVAKGLARRAAKAATGDVGVVGVVEEQLSRLRDARTIDALGSEADLVVEAALEDLALKQTIFRALGEAAAADAILATNTSALSVGAIAMAASRPERVLGLHFFNPAPLMALVEVVVASGTAAAIVDRAEAVVAAWGKTPIRTRDVPGFIVNRVNRPFTLEPLRLLEEGEAGIVAIDDAVVAEGFPLGPFAYMDLVGLDVNLAAARAVWQGLGRPGRLRPSPIQESLVETGHLGRKTGRGFYLYPDGRRMGPSPEFEDGAGESRIPSAEIVRRVRTAIALEAISALRDGVASAEQIDRAVRLGANHPSGPLEWASSHGIDGANPPPGR
jgi:3-hydroxybutyryl-CoA dehydrogenase